jgi:hypothetical protein
MAICVKGCRRWLFFLIGKFMKTLLALVVGAIALLGIGATWAQSGTMMNGSIWSGGWMGGGMGGYGGLWTILLVIVAVGLLAWIFKRGGK